MPLGLAKQTASHNNKGNPPPGCPENSYCSLKTGKHHQRWMNLINAIIKNNPPLSQQKIHQKLSSFVQKGGFPFSFWTIQGAEKKFSPILWDSHCKHHKNKHKPSQIYLGKAFVTQLKKQTATIKRNNEVYEIPFGPFFRPDPIFIFSKRGKTWNVFYAPAQDVPLHMHNNELVFIQEEEGFYYLLKLQQNGGIKVQNYRRKNLPETQTLNCQTLPLWEKIKKSEKNIPFSTYYRNFVCKEIWDTGKKIMKIMVIPRPC